jgi:hypothetical protein
VERVRLAGDHRFAHLAAHRRDRRAAVVAARGARLWTICTGGSRSVGLRLEELGLTHLKNRGMLLRRLLPAEQDTHGRWSNW